MDDNVLSQEEIDALLNDVSDEESSELDAQKIADEELEAQAIENGDVISFVGDDDADLKPLDFENQERIIRGQFPVLERIHERMSRGLTDELFLLFSREVEVEQEPFSVIKCKEFLATLESPLVMSVYRFDPLRSKGLIIFNGAAIFEIVENYFGGHSQSSKIIDEERDLTVTEVKTINMVTKKVVEKLESAWASIKPINLEYIRTETSTQMLNLYSATDLLITTRFKCSFGANNSAFYIVMPYMMIDPIREQLELGASQSDQEDDPNWVNALKNELLNVKLNVSAELAQKVIKLEDVKNWKEGDFIPLEISETVPMSVENNPLFMVKVGTSNDKCSLQIVSKIDY